MKCMYIICLFYLFSLKTISIQTIQQKKDAKKFINFSASSHFYYFY